MRDRIFHKNVFSICSVVLAVTILCICYCGHEPKGKVNPYDPNGDNYIYLSIGNDTTVSIYSKINLHGSVLDKERIEKWEWKFGDNNWIRTSGCDTTIIAPGYEVNYPCTLKVTDVKGNSVYSSKNIVVINNNDNNLLSIKSSDSIVGIYDTFHIYTEIASIVLIKKLEWKFGSNSWVETSSNDTTIMAPGYIGGFLCSLKVINDFGTIIYSSIKITTCSNNNLLSIIVSDSVTAVGDTVQIRGEVSNVVNVNRWEWKFADNDWIETSGNDTSLIFSFNAPIYICSLRIINDYGTEIYTMREISVFFSFVSLISLGYEYTMILKTNGTLWATGYNINGQLGDGTNIHRNITKQIMSDVSLVSAGGDHTMMLKADGTLWATGHNPFGELGDGTNISKNQPVQILSDISSVSAGGSHTIILKNDGTVWASGYNMYGQLGDGTDINKNIPVQIMGNVSSVFAGSNHTMILMTDGTVWATGSNNYGQLGDSTYDDKKTPVQILSGVSLISVGLYYTIILKNDGTLWATGRNDYGQLGDGTLQNRNTPTQVMSGVSSVSTGFFHTIILKGDGTLWATGYNVYGQLGDGTDISKNIPVQIMSDVSSVYAGGNHTLILKTDGTLWATGENSRGQLGDGTSKNKKTPVRI